MYGEEEGFTWRQSYRFVVKWLCLATYNGSHPRRRRASRQAQRKLRTIAGNNSRPATQDPYRGEGVLRRDPGLGSRNYWRRSVVARRMKVQPARSAGKVIGKGKVHQQYEFGCKISMVRIALSGIIVGLKSFTGNPYDSDTLAPALEQVQHVRENAEGNR